jgi:hypothetical protein
MRKTGGGGLSANFANFREFFGRGILAADDWDSFAEDRTSNFEPCSPIEQRAFIFPPVRRVL